MRDARHTTLMRLGRALAWLGWCTGPAVPPAIAHPWPEDEAGISPLQGDLRVLRVPPHTLGSAGELGTVSAEQENSRD